MHSNWLTLYATHVNHCTMSGIFVGKISNIEKNISKPCNVLLVQREMESEDFQDTAEHIKAMLASSAYISRSPGLEFPDAVPVTLRCYTNNQPSGHPYSFYVKPSHLYSCLCHTTSFPPPHRENHIISSKLINSLNKLKYYFVSNNASF